MSEPNWARAQDLEIGQAVDLGSMQRTGTYSQIADLRPRSAEWPMTVAILVEGSWRVLPAEAWYDVESA